jgi:hypothetical protein
MQRTTTFVTCSLASQILFSQAYLEWGRRLGGTNFVEPTAVAVDEEGNVYTAGTFREDCDFDPSVSGIQELTAYDFEDIFITKLDASGAFVWVSRFRSTASPAPNDIAVDAAGNIYLTGSFSDSLDIDPGPLEEFLTTGNGFINCFLLKLDATGALQWGYQWGGESDFDQDNVAAMDLSSSGDVVLTGLYYGSVDFDPGPGDVSLPGPYGTFIMELGSTGQFHWVKGVVGNDNGDSFRARDIAVSLDESILIVGDITGTIDLDPGNGSSIYSTASPGDDIGIVSLNSEGAFQWAHGIGGDGFQRGYSVDTDLGNRVLVAGAFDGVTDFDPGSGVEELDPSNGSSVFLLVLSPTGSFVAVRQPGDEYAEGWDSKVRVGPDDAVYLHYGSYAVVTGEMQTIAAHVADPVARGGAAMALFIERWSPDADLIWSKVLYPVWASASALEIDAGSNIFSTAPFSDTLDVDPNLDVVELIPSGTNRDALVHKMRQCFPTTSSTTVSACDSYTWEANDSTYLATATDTVALLNVQGCDSTITLLLTIISVEAAIEVVGETLLAEPEGAGYQWIDCSSSEAIPGETEQTFTPAVAGIYAVIATINACSDTSECQDLNVGLLAATMQAGITVLPNPTSGSTTIRFGALQEGILIRLLNATGQEVRVLRAQNTDHVVVDLDVAKALYMLDIRNESDERTMIRLIVQ